MAIDRTDANRALAKVIAFKNCGKEEDALMWFHDLADILGYEDQLK